MICHTKNAEPFDRSIFHRTGTGSRRGNLNGKGRRRLAFLSTGQKSGEASIKRTHTHTKSALRQPVDSCKIEGVMEHLLHDGGIGPARKRNDAYAALGQILQKEQI